MRVFRSGFIGALVLAGTSLWAGNQAPAKPGETVVANQYIVRLLPGSSTDGLQMALPSGSQWTHIRSNIYLVNVPPESSSQSLVEDVANLAEVDFVEPNRIRTTSVQPANDPNFSSQWALQTLQALQAWEIVPNQYLTASTPEAGRIKVAVIDTGVDCSHPDFANSGGTSTDSAHGGQLSFSLSHAYSQTIVANAACPWQDDFGHGTHVAGIIAAATQNGIGVSALGYPLELIVYKALASNGAGDDATIGAAIMAATDAGARVISLSVGGTGYSHTMQVAVNYAWQHNALVVAAAGNYASSDPFFPADANYAVAVAASDSNNARAGWSNYGNSIDIAAPGVNIFSTVPTYLTPLGGGASYGSLSGTSMATPHVSALAGLVAMVNPGAPMAAVWQRIQQSATSSISNGGWDQFFGYGVINAYNALSGNLRPATLGSLVGQVVETHSFPLIADVTVNGQTVTTDSTGTFRFANLAPGTYTISASSSYYGTQSVTAAVTSGADTTMTVMIGIAYGRFTGRVRDGAGAAVPGAIVQALAGGLIQATAVSDLNGQYTLWTPNGGTYDVRAAALSRQTATAASQSVSAGASTALDLSLPALGYIYGAVQDGNQKRVANADVLISGNGVSTGAVTDSNGSFSSVALPAGSYSVTASASGLPSTTLAVAVSGGAAAVTITLGQGTTPVAVTVGPGNVSLFAGQPRQFNATVTGTSNAAVTWSVNPPMGAVVNGLYTAPALIASAASVNIIATSVADPSKSGSVAVTLVPVSVSVNPSSASLSVGQSQQFTASVNGSSNSAVSWSVNPAVGTVVNGLYTPPTSIASAQNVTVTASSVADPAKSASAVVSLVPVSVSINPQSANLSVGQSQQFTATVTGPGNTAVSWSISPAVGTVVNGFYTAPPSLANPQNVTVTATSVADPSKSASAVVSLVQVAVAVNPSSVSLSVGQSQQFTATVSGSSNSAVSWSVIPAVGTMVNGFYTAPASIAFAQSVTVTARSVADPARSASAVVSLIPVSVSINPGNASLSVGQSQQFTASVSGAGNSAVSWSLNPQVGSVANGLYTPPASIAFPQVVTVTATSVADVSKSASAVVTLVPVTVSITPPSAVLASGNSQLFSARVTGPPNTNVVWSVSPNLGSITQGGNYTAPANLASPATVTVTATSAADPSMSAFAIVALLPAPPASNVTVTITPPSTTLSGNQVIPFAATVTGTTQTGVVWSMTPSLGTLFSNGLYIAPPGGATAQTVTIKATSVSDPAKSASAIVTIRPFVKVSLSPAAVWVSASKTLQMTATVTGSTNTGVVWSIYPARGSITQTGLYTAPPDVNGVELVNVTAVSLADPNSKSTTILFLKP